MRRPLSLLVFWSVWLIVALAIAGYLWFVMRSSDTRLFLPGQTTAGHYQIELSCVVCHDNPDGSTSGTGGVNQAACLKCHEQELERVGDSHPIAKFAKATDAALLQPLDNAMNKQLVQSRYCITCHVEHKPQGTRAMGLTQPEDYCQACHADIYENRETHKGLGFNTCLTAGCHNFHDNSGLFEQFMIDHLNDPDFKDKAVRPLRDYAARHRKKMEAESEPIIALTRASQDAPNNVKADEQILVDWEATAHAAAGINCTDCHNQKDATGRLAWVDKPTFESCRTCHEGETHGFLGSRHGMRLDQGLPPMTPGQARLPMKAAADAMQMTCNACHGSHRFDTKFAAFQACIQCHDDEHTNAFAGTTHHELWMDEMSGKGAPATGVSCATCHLPRVVEGPLNNRFVGVKHNQNDFLRPNEKMIRAVCMDCHGLGFTLDALADRELIRTNFSREPANPHFEPSSFDLIHQKLDKLRKEGRIEN